MILVLVRMSLIYKKIKIIWIKKINNHHPIELKNSSKYHPIINKINNCQSKYMDSKNNNINKFNRYHLPIKSPIHQIPFCRESHSGKLSGRHLFGRRHYWTARIIFPIKPALLECPRSTRFPPKLNSLPYGKGACHQNAICCKEYFCENAPKCPQH